ncbi:DUF945 family protein [Reinekea blandensis]|uniref:DUF945 domain-containing protein n=1 Tax=Reinekea blandensis MED297 TaxID=314283 RepID=A4BCB2_9GAMM|nr:DUF945 family protein [Reinekea blandensis]EAR10178.1 hypothetical protein MED297_13182 [Reinekea sp. MED297] [Reinekea blandensis MED297]
MKYLAAGIAATVVVVGGVTAGSLVISDNKIDEQVDRLTTVAEQSGFKVSVEQDTNTWLSRQLSLRLTASDGSLPVPILINNDITQRPWRTNVQHEVLLDSQISDPTMDPELQALLNRYLVDRPFLTGTSQISASGNYQTQLQSIAVNETEADWSVSMSPMTVDIAGTVSGEVVMQGQWPGMNVASQTESTQLNIAPVSFSAEGQSLASGLFDGTQTASIESINIQIDDDYPTTFVLDALTFTANGEVVDQLYSGAMTVSMDKINIDEETTSMIVDDLSMTTSFSGLEAGNYERLMAEVAAMDSTGVPSAALKDEANVLLKNGFNISFDDWHATVNDQSVQLAAQLTVPKNELVDVNVPISLMGLFPMISASADVTIDAGLVDIPELYDPMMGLLMTGALISQGDEYVMNASLENGRVMLNGQPMPLPF